MYPTSERPSDQNENEPQREVNPNRYTHYFSESHRQDDEPDQGGANRYTLVKNLDTTKWTYPTFEIAFLIGVLSNIEGGSVSLRSSAAVCGRAPPKGLNKEDRLATISHQLPL